MRKIFSLRRDERDNIEQNKTLQNIPHILLLIYAHSYDCWNIQSDSRKSSPGLVLDVNFDKLYIYYRNNMSINCINYIQLEKNIACVFCYN